MLCGEREQGTVAGACRRGRPHTVWMDNIKTWRGLSVEESVRMAEDRESTSVVWSTLGSTSSRLGAVQAAKLVAGLTESGRDESYPVLGRSEP